jgi:hypothetical protein
MMVMRGRAGGGMITGAGGEGVTAGDFGGSLAAVVGRVVVGRGTDDGGLASS